MQGPIQFVATDVLYYHDADERAFFEWLDRMCFVDGYHGIVRDLFIVLNRFPTDEDLLEIFGFCRRYGIDMTQLAKFETDDNRDWMRDTKMVWSNEIFGSSDNVDGS